MSQSTRDIKGIAKLLDTAAREGRTVPQISLELPDLTVEEAYRIQRASIARRIRRGARLVGMKMGLTSLAKMEQMGVHAPIYGHLTSDMILEDGGTFAHGALGHPRVEPEVAFVLGADLHGPVTPAQALLAVDGVCAALEVINSRYANFRFSLPDVIADNASSALFVLGSRVVSPADLDLGNLGMVMSINGVVSQVGSSAAILDHPARSLAALAGLLAESGEHLKAGQIVLAGGATAAVALQPGDRVHLEVDSLGCVDLAVRMDAAPDAGADAAPDAGADAAPDAGAS
ncbi:MAG: 4-oxalocrotonate decarboxylase [Deltaproteobacteria bacterium]|nr:MAG: 4-oxalocrotonate decarboxylase [Deltaproteobacteria bacterium]